MDRKSLIIIIVAVVTLWLLSSVVNHFYPPKPVTIPPPNSMTNEQGNVPGTPPETNIPMPATALSSPTAEPSSPEETLMVTNDVLIFEFTSRGGGLKEVLLPGFPSVISRTGDPSLKTNWTALNINAPAPVLSLLGPGAQTGDNFKLTQKGMVVTAEKTLTNGLRVVKEFDIGTNYLFTAHVRLENTSAQPLTIPEREMVIGTATPIGPLDDPTALGTFWYNGIKAENIKQPWFANRTLGCFPGTPRDEYEGGASNVVWAAVHNQFFTLATIPSNPAPRILIHRISIPAPETPPQLASLTNATTATLTNGYEAIFVYPATTLQAHQTLDRGFTFYAGPKDYYRLGQIGERMDNNLDLIMGFNGPIGFFSKMLLLSMNGLMKVFKIFHLDNYGLAIIAITVIIKLIFWPLTRASTRSQKRMQALQPQLKAIADKYKDDPMKKNQKTMEFMKEQKVSPLGSCLPTVIQIPVFFGFYALLRNAIELRGVHFLWAHDLSQPDTVAYLPFLGGFPVNPLPLIMGATQLWQQFLLPPSPGMDPGQQKMMRYMPLMFIAILYRMSAGLTLYWTVSNLLSILQTKITKTTDPAAPAATVAVVPKKKK